MTPYTYHRLLLRQIKKITGSFSEILPADFEKLLQVVSLTYEEYEKSQDRSDRAASLMSEELLQLNRKIQADAQHELALSEQKYFNMVNNISGIIFSYYWQDDKIIPIFISRQVEDITSYPSEDFTTGRIDFFSIMHPDDITQYQEAIRGNQQNKGLYQIEYRILNREGAEIWVVEQGRIVSENGQLKVDGVIINITRQKQAEQQLMEIALEAKEANRAKSEFLSNMSHELRTPMHSILSYAELGMTGIDLNEPIDTIRNSFETIGKSGNRLLKLLNNLLDLARMESGKTRYHFGQHDMIKVARQALEEINTLAEKKGITITEQYSENPIDIFIDSDRIVQVLINLLSNAIKFTDAGKGVKLTIKSYQDAGYLSIEVMDQGVGIPEEQMETIFNPFVQSSRTSRGSGGTGLGLSISTEIVKAHEGKIWAFNNKDEGATFQVDIPFKGNGHENIGNR